MKRVPHRGSDRRERVSARHQVKRLDRGSKGCLHLPGYGSAEENGFSSFGADLHEIRYFTLVFLLGVKSGPDVFADALVPAVHPLFSFPLTIPAIPRATRRVISIAFGACACSRRQGKAPRVYAPFIATLKLPFKPVGHDPRNRLAVGRNDSFEDGANNKGGIGMFQGHFDLDGAVPVEATAIPDVLFERGLYWASGRSGVINLVAAHKWFNLAALKGRHDAIAMRREVAEQMSDAEIAIAQREARAWMSSH